MVQLLLYYVVCTAVASASLGGHLLYSIYATILYEYARGVTETAQSRNRMRRTVMLLLNQTSRFYLPTPVSIHWLRRRGVGRGRPTGRFIQRSRTPLLSIAASNNKSGGRGTVELRGGFIVITDGFIIITLTSHPRKTPDTA